MLALRNISRHTPPQWTWTRRLSDMYPAWKDNMLTIKTTQNGCQILPKEVVSRSVLFKFLRLDPSALPKLFVSKTNFRSLKMWYNTLWYSLSPKCVMYTPMYHCAIDVSSLIIPFGVLFTAIRKHRVLTNQPILSQLEPKKSPPGCWMPNVCRMYTNLMLSASYNAYQHQAQCLVMPCTFCWSCLIGGDGWPPKPRIFMMIESLWKKVCHSTCTKCVCWQFEVQQTYCYRQLVEINHREVTIRWNCWHCDHLTTNALALALHVVLMPSDHDTTPGTPQIEDIKPCRIFRQEKKRGTWPAANKPTQRYWPQFHYLVVIAQNWSMICEWQYSKGLFITCN